MKAELDWLVRRFESKLTTAQCCLFRTTVESDHARLRCNQICISILYVATLRRTKRTSPPAPPYRVDLNHPGIAAEHLSYSVHTYDTSELRKKNTTTHLADVLLHQLRSRHADEGAIRVVRHGPRQQRLPGPRRPVQENALGLSPIGGTRRRQTTWAKKENIHDIST